MAAEGRHRTHDGAEVARVGDVVQGDQKRWRRIQCGSQQIIGMGVVVRRHLQRDALMKMVGGHPVQIGPGHFENRNSGVGGSRDGLGQSLVRFDTKRDVERRRRHAGPQAFQHRVAAQHGFGFVSAASGRPALLRFGPLRGGMVGPHVCGRRGTAPFQTTTALAAGPDAGAFLVPDLRIAPRR